MAFSRLQGGGHPRVIAALDHMDEIEPTTEKSNCGSQQVWVSLEYLGGQKKLLGREAAVDNLYRGRLALAWIEDGLPPPSKNVSDRQAVILLGAPAAGKSTVAHPLARARSAAIIDADEAKKIIPEYQGGVGANAVHEESGTLGKDVLRLAIAAGDNILLPKVGAGAASIEKLIDDLAASGYRVEAVLVDAPPPTPNLRPTMHGCLEEMIAKGELPAARARLAQVAALALALPFWPCLLNPRDGLAAALIPRYSGLAAYNSFTAHPFGRGLPRARPWFAAGECDHLPPDHSLPKAPDTKPSDRGLPRLASCAISASADKAPEIRLA